MGHASVTVRLSGTVVEERLLALAPGDRLGDTPDARVRFPGAVLLVTAGPGGLHVGGRRLAPEPLDLRLGDVEVSVRAVVVRPRGLLDAIPDPRLPVLTAAAILLGASIDAGVRLLDAHPDLGARLHAWILGEEP